jgi:hypothetical protein
MFTDLKRINRTSRAAYGGLHMTHRPRLTLRSLGKAKADPEAETPEAETASYPASYPLIQKIQQGCGRWVQLFGPPPPLGLPPPTAITHGLPEPMTQAYTNGDRKASKNILRAFR